MDSCAQVNLNWTHLRCVAVCLRVDRVLLWSCRRGVRLQIWGTVGNLPEWTRVSVYSYTWCGRVLRGQRVVWGVVYRRASCDSNRAPFGAKSLDWVSNRFERVLVPARLRQTGYPAGTIDVEGQAGELL